MKIKLFGFFKGLLIMSLGVLAAMALYQFSDILGFFGRWVQERYLTFSGYPGENGTYYFETSINWDGVKRDIFILLIINTIIWLGAVLAAGASAKRREQKRLSAEMAEIRADMRGKEQELKAETARKNDLIAYLAHDLKTPLTSVIGYLSLLDEAPDMPRSRGQNTPASPLIRRTDLRR